MDLKQNKIMPESEGPVLCLEVTQPVLLEAYNNMYIPALTSIYEQYGEVRILYYYPSPENFPGWEETAAAQDLKNFTEHGHNVKKVALVNAPNKVAQRWDLMSPLLGGEVREFSVEEFDTALKWIKACSNDNL